MKAPVLFRQRAPLRVEELEVEPARDGEISVLYLAGKLRPDDLITGRYSIDEANEGFQDLAAGAVARGLIVF